jgi:hypothetical protein
MLLGVFWWIHEWLGRSLDGLERYMWRSFYGDFLLELGWRRMLSDPGFEGMESCILGLSQTKSLYCYYLSVPRLVNRNLC